MAHMHKVLTNFDYRGFWRSDIKVWGGKVFGPLKRLKCNVYPIKNVNVENRFSPNVHCLRDGDNHPPCYSVRVPMNFFLSA